MQRLFKNPSIPAMLKLPRADLQWRLIQQAIEAEKQPQLDSAIERPLDQEDASNWQAILTLLLHRCQAQGCPQDIIDSLQTACSNSWFKDGKHNQPLLEALLLLVENQNLYPLSKERLLRKTIAPLLETFSATSKRRQKNKKDLEKETKIKITLFHQNICNLVALLNFNDREICMAHDNRTISQLLEASFLKIVPLKARDNFQENWAKTFGQSRSPFGPMIYAAKLSQLKDRKVLEDCATFVDSVLLGTFSQVRNALDHNPHLQKIPSQVLQKWLIAEAPFEIGNGMIVMETEDPIDLLMAGTEVPHSCQDIHNYPHINKGLLGYILNGQIRMIVIKSKNDPQGKIISRALIKLPMWEEQVPVVLLEQLYLNQKSPAQEQAILTMAKQKVRSMQLAPSALVSMDGNSAPDTSKLVFFGGRASFEYSDANDLGVVPRGKYTITGFKGV